MQDSKKVLESKLGAHFKGEQRRILVLTRLILGILHLGSVSYSKLSKVLNELVKRSSNYKRIQRFMKGFIFDRGVYIQFVWSLFVKKNNWVALSIDRTNWKFGQSNINILLLGISYKGTAIPLVWKLLNKRGNSNTLERIELLESLKSALKEEQLGQLRCLLMDREFVGKEWVSYLKKQPFTFITRIRYNTKTRKLGKCKELAAHLLFQDEYFKALRKQRIIWGHQLFIAGQKNGDKDYLILVSNQPLTQGKKFYGERWGIEVFFAACKTRGFNFEDTHVTMPERIFNLLFLIALAFVWAIKTGEWLINNGTRIPIKKIKHRKAKLYSIFRIGFDHLQERLLYHMPLISEIRLLSCT